MIGFRLQGILFGSCHSGSLSQDESGSLVNSWCTSRRLHEHRIHKCFFCGEWDDDLAHYINCNVLWRLIVSAANMGTGWLSVPPQVRLGLVNPSHKVMKLLACAFSVYHAIPNTLRIFSTFKLSLTPTPWRNVYSS